MNRKSLNFELHRVRKEIEIHGDSFTFWRNKTDEYGEKAKGEREKITVIQGLFHISKGYVTENIQEGTHTHSKGQPMLLVVMSEEENKIKNGDFVYMGETEYKVIEKNNIQNYDIVADISLEVALNGRI